jgi:hypothetical protein
LQDVERALELLLAADQRIDGAAPGELREVLREGGERVVAARRVLRLLVVLGVAAVRRHRRARDGEPGDAVRQIAHHVEPRDPLGLQHVDGVGLGLVVHGHQEVRSLDLVAAGRLGAHRGARERALRAQGEARLQLLVLVDLDALQRLGEILLQPVLELPQVGAGIAQDFGGLFIEGEGVQDVLQTGVLVAEAPRLVHRHRQGDLEIA